MPPALGNLSSQSAGGDVGLVQFLTFLFRKLVPLVQTAFAVFLINRHCVQTEQMPA